MPCGTPLPCLLKTIKFPIADGEEAFVSQLWTALLRGSETKGSARAHELACETATRKTLWKPFWQRDSAYESPSFYQFPKACPGHTSGATLRFEQYVGFILWTLALGSRDYASTHLTATALFWCVAMEFQKQNKENHCSVIVTKLLSPSTENQV